MWLSKLLTYPALKLGSEFVDLDVCSATLPVLLEWCGRVVFSLCVHLWVKPSSCLADVTVLSEREKKNHLDVRDIKKGRTGQQ